MGSDVCRVRKKRYRPKENVKIWIKRLTSERKEGLRPSYYMRTITNTFTNCNDCISGTVLPFLSGLVFLPGFSQCWEVDLVTAIQNQVSCFFLVLGYSPLTICWSTIYLPYSHERDINLLINLSARKQRAVKMSQ